MADLASIYRHLESLPDPSVDQALAAAIPTADPQALTLIVRTMLQRPPSDASIALIRHYHRFDKDLQIFIRSRPDAMARGIWIALATPDGALPAQALELLTEARAYRFAHLLGEPLRRGAPEVRRRAAELLRDFVQDLTQAQEQGQPLDALTDQALVTAVVEALKNFAFHHQPAVLDAVLMLAERGWPEVAEILADARHPAVAPLAAMLAQVEHAHVRRALLPMCLLPTLRQAAEAGLRRIDQPEQLPDLIRQASLLQQPEVRSALGKRMNPAGLLPDEVVIAQLSPARRALLPLWITALPLEPAARLEALIPLVRHDDRGTRLAALRAMLPLALDAENQAVAQVIGVLTADRDPVIATLALRHLIRLKHGSLARLLPNLVNSPHPPVRRLAESRLAPLAFVRLWDAWPRLTEAQRLAAGRAMVKLDVNFPAALSAKLAQGDKSSQLRALAMIYTLGQGPLFEPALLQLVKDADVRIAASAAKALGTVDSPTSIAALEACLKHADSRCRANAVEALEQLHSHRHIERLLEMAESDDNRPRANAIRALMHVKMRDAVPALAKMLADPRPRQRISALWLVETTGLLEVARQVAELSLVDPTPDVRKRAERTMNQLLEMVRHAQHQAGALVEETAR